MEGQIELYEQMDRLFKDYRADRLEMENMCDRYLGAEDDLVIVGESFEDWERKRKHEKERKAAA